MKEKKNKKKRVNEKEKKIEVVERLNIVNLELKQEKQVEKPRDRKQIFFTGYYYFFFNCYSFFYY